MWVQINTDRNILHDEALEEWITGVIESALGRSSDRITRVGVHMSDEHGRKSSRYEKRCMMETRIEGRGPVAVIDHAATLDKAVSGAAGKLGVLLNRAAGRAAVFKASPIRR